ncbi:lysylphosphatidylglycerol synthase domain-containing protein [Sphingomonas sp. LR55]|uniref:lysylphosphatidylglycerol synthase domain-containing protein n=1 Tax=Sphingomonas sp. LR55 TaxID=3050231 RepID=UPI002FE201A4
MIARWRGPAWSGLRRATSSRSVRTGVAVVAMLAIVGIAVSALSHLLDGVNGSDIRTALSRINWPRLFAAAVVTAISYGVLTGYDVVALRIVGKRVRYTRAALASFTSYVFSHNFGFALLTGGTARLRIYQPAGLTIGEVAHIMVLTGVTFWSGVLLLLGFGLIVQPGTVAVAGVALSYPVHAAIGGSSFAILAAVLVGLKRRAGRTLVLFGRSIPLPSVSQALAQIMLASVDIVLAATALFVLLRDAEATLFPALLLGYLVAIVTGLITHAPGGVGVFEAVMLVSLPDIDRASLFAALLAYRVVYYLIPLAIGMLLFGIHELRGARVRSA